MKVPKDVLLPLVAELNSTPCKYCGEQHHVMISRNPSVYIEVVGASCAEWDMEVHNRAKKILENFIKGIRLQ